MVLPIDWLYRRAMDVYKITEISISNIENAMKNSGSNYINGFIITNMTFRKTSI